MVKRVVDYKCPACHAVLKFNPKKQNWKCEYCDSEFSLDDLKNNEDNYDKKDVFQEEEIEDKGEYDLYHCPDCGASIVTDKNTSATFCVYCKNTSIIKERLVGKFEPASIIPFNKTIDDAKEAFKRVGRKHPLMPRSFNNVKNINEIKGIYIPFWLFSGTSSGGIELKGTKVKTWHSGNYQYTKTDIYNIVREGEVSFTKVPNDGSVKFDDAIMNSIEPFDYSKLVPFSPSYLSGFLAEKYDVLEEDAKKVAVKRMKNTTVNALSHDVYGYASTVVEKNNINFPKLSSSYVLLPVYLLNIKYNDKFYTFAMNGESGKMIGNMPVDKKRAVQIFIRVFVIVFIVCLVMFYMFFRKVV